ncbi:hypothetical protein [Naasia sp. SYSU D00948]|uniref:hypothetical protein n=1 Tax=Naasia sp. SYSU D00948 TaxID=2817379 RepID=UPI001B3118CA|nr:hypothetical protein [Naasia sp. SYSU D00948]
MVWRLRRRARSGADGAGPAAAEPSSETHTDEGLLIAATAIRLGAKNRLIVHALRDGEPFDREWFTETLREDVEALAEERESDAQRLAAARASARRRLGRPRHFHDYRHADVRRLALREQADLELAQRLRALLGEEEFVGETLTAAQESALDEILSAEQARRAELAGFVADDRYIAEREERLAALRSDLEALQRARSW